MNRSAFRVGLVAFRRLAYFVAVAFSCPALDRSACLRRGFVGLVLALIVGFAGPAAATPIVVDDVNGSGTPQSGTSWGVTNIGWVYTAPFEYDLVGVNTRIGFNNQLPRVLTLEVFDDAPSLGGTLLRSTSFTIPTSFNTAFWAGGTFAPLALIAGEDYFIGFRNMNNLGVNATGAAGSENLQTFRDGLSLDYGVDIAGIGGVVDSPILELLAEPAASAVPEPASLLLFGTGLVGAGVRRWRKGRAA